jgi:spore germination protein GerM
MRSNTILAVGLLAVLGIGGSVLLNSNQRVEPAPSPAGHMDVTEQAAAPANPNVVKPHKEKTQIEIPYYVLQDTKDDVQLARRTAPLVVQGAAAPWRLAHTALRAMESFPRTEGAYRSPVPQGGRILGVQIAQNGLATVNLSKEFQENFNGGAREEQVTIYAIVNTVGHIATVKGVVFEVDGKKIDEFAGHLDLTDPLTPDDSLVGNAK